MNILHLQNLKKSYPHSSGAIEVLMGINTQILKGQSVAIIGPSGSGKSTLLSMLAGLDAPTSGSISIAGNHLEKMSEEELTDYRAKNLGIVFQKFHLMSHLTAQENVALPLKIAEDSQWAAKSIGALESVGLGHRLAHFPHELSGGECQRVAIARAMVGNPPIILADEPSGNLDSKTGESVMELLFNLVREHKGTLVLVTHNEELAKQCDRQLTLQEGLLIEK